MRGRVVKLDRGFPLVRTKSGEEYRAKHATSLVKGEQVRAVIGDVVELDIPEGHDTAIIKTILPRTNSLVRKDPAEQALSQVLAANFNLILIAQPIIDLNFRRLERELVLAHQTGAQVMVLLTKADLFEDERSLEKQIEEVQEVLGEEKLLVLSSEDKASIEELRSYIPEGTTAVLVGKSGVGKSSLVNLLVGEEVQGTTAVREADGRGRHTTVSREIIDIPGGGSIVDMPGVRGLGLWDAEAGLENAFSDIETLAQSCRFRDCKHDNEPGCAVRKACEDGDLSAARLSSYRNLVLEKEEIKERRREAEQLSNKTPRRAKKSGRKRSS